MLPALSQEAQAYATYWLGAICTLAIYTILYRENRLYRLFEHFYIGVALGFGFYMNFKEVIYEVWWKAMMTESTGTVFNFDAPPPLEGVRLDKTEKKEGEGCWVWETVRVPKLPLTGFVKEWGSPNYLKVWVRTDQPVPDGRVTVTIEVKLPQSEEGGLLRSSFPVTEDRWQLLRLELRDFEVQGTAYRPFLEAGKHYQLGEVINLELEANDALQKAGARVFLDDLTHNIGYRWWWVLSGLWGVLFYTLFIPRLAWMSRLAMGVPLGLGAGYTFKAFVLELGPQIEQSFKPLYGVSFATLVNNIIFILALLCVMTYFFFSIEHRHFAIRHPAQLGRWLLMATFGIVFGNTVMGRFSLFIARADFLIRDMKTPWELPEWARLLIIFALQGFFILLAYLSVVYERWRDRSPQSPG
ncbi:MAG: hypothetical protein NZ959_08680 [Armatimonadetes bacterium]|nr:hypothetical protein [Armatimonadota bacterium]MDW8122545.1 hypothetical protein [Armatimonadota bacterium]